MNPDIFWVAKLFSQVTLYSYPFEYFSTLNKSSVLLKYIFSL